MLRTLASRIAWAAVIAFGVSTLTFVILDALPGNAAAQLLGMEATADQVAALESRLGLRDPLWKRYVGWLAATLRADLGHSLASAQPVADLILQRAPVSLELVTLALSLSLSAAIPFALLCARFRGSSIDRLGSALSIAALSAPVYVFSLALILIFSVKASLFPALGFVPLSTNAREHFASMTLPAISLALPLFGLYGRFLRADLVEQLLQQDYIIAARAKGLGSWSVIVRHALPNSSFGLLTLVGLHFGTLVGATVVVEQVFALPGLGQLLLQGVGLRDVPVIQGVVLVLALVTCAASTTVDILYAVLDPRVRQHA